MFRPSKNGFKKSKTIHQWAVRSSLNPSITLTPPRQKLSKRRKSEIEIDIDLLRTATRDDSQIIKAPKKKKKKKSHQGEDDIVAESLTTDAMAPNLRLLLVYSKSRKPGCCLHSKKSIESTCISYLLQCYTSLSYYD